MKKSQKINAAIIYARKDSSRFPNKIFSEISGYSILENILRRSKHLDVDLVIIATTNRKIDDDIEIAVDEFKKSNVTNLYCFRGDALNLIKRTQQVIDHYSISNFCRINGDSPFYPIKEINSAFKMIKNDIKFINNIRFRSFPYGIAIEVLTSAFFIDSLQNNQFIQNEHMTSHIYKKAKTNQEIILKNQYSDLSLEKLVVDTESDLKQINFKVSQIDKMPWQIHYTDF